MNHELALGINAPERYLLNEMSEDQRFEFEAHYFSCELCAEEVRKGELLARGIKAMGGELAVERHERQKRGRTRWNWFSPAFLIPSFAAFAMVLITGYQSLFVIPALRLTLEPQSLNPIFLRGVARGEEPSVSVSRGAGESVLMLDVNNGNPGDAITWTIQPPNSNPSVSGKAIVPPAGTQLQILTPNSYLQSAGLWTVVLKNDQNAELGRYIFRIQTQEGGK